MGKIGEGYGSEFHLRRYLREGQEALEQAVLSSVGIRDARCEWLPFPATNGVDRELKGLEFLHAESRARADWARFWPTSGTPQNWDAVGRLHTAAGTEWLIVEAKARARELMSPACGAKGVGREMIARALSATRRHLGVPQEQEWMGTYYQIANRLAAHYFLNEVAKESARLLFVYFTGDAFPDGSACPRNEEEWTPLIDQANTTLALPSRLDRVHHVFLPVLA